MNVTKRSMISTTFQGQCAQRMVECARETSCASMGVTIQKRCEGKIAAPYFSVTFILSLLLHSQMSLTDRREVQSLFHSNATVAHARARRGRSRARPSRFLCCARGGFALLTRKATKTSITESTAHASVCATQDEGGIFDDKSMSVAWPPLFLTRVLI
jgi:hypothetical protein